LTDGKIPIHITPCIYEGLGILILTTTLIKSLLSTAMAMLNVDDSQPSYVEIHADGEGVSISFLIGSDGFAVVTTLCLSLWFQLNAMSLHIDEDVYDSTSGDLIYTISQSPICNGNGKYWLLRPGRFRLYGLSEFVMVASTGLAIPISFPNYTI
jgi:hypothetical protein